MSRNRLYVLFLFLSLAGYIWISWNIYRIYYDEKTVSICLFRTVTGFPCPSCGTTHSVLAILKGNFHEALKLNPFGFVVLPVILILPVWILLDLFRNNNSFFRFYGTMEKIIGRKWIAYPAIILLMLNWILRIYACW